MFIKERKKDMYSSCSGKGGLRMHIALQYTYFVDIIYVPAMLGKKIKKMGNMKDLLGMIPGVGKALKDVDIKDDAFKHIEAIIQSMTPYERTNPQVLNTSRKQRIASGSGRNIQEVNRLIKQFDDMRKMMRMVQANGGKLPKIRR